MSKFLGNFTFSASSSTTAYPTTWPPAGGGAYMFVGNAGTLTVRKADDVVEPDATPEEIAAARSGLKRMLRHLRGD